MKRIMLDLETLGQRPGCIILSIGAVAFDTTGIADTFYRKISAQSCESHGLHADASTILWWFKQSAEARHEHTSENRIDLPTALDDFSRWAGTNIAEVWGNGSDFDNAILSAAYHATAQPSPWPFFANRCYRTLKNLFPEVTLDRQGTHHNALDDASTQAEHLIRILAKL